MFRFFFLSLQEYQKKKEKMVEVKQLTDIQKKAIKDQQEKIALCVRDLEEKGVALLSGGAGYGKTWCAKSIIEEYMKGRSGNLLLTTTSHKALHVTGSFMEGTDLDYEVCTNASATNAVKHTDPDGATYFAPKEKYRFHKGKKIIIPPPISKADFIHQDECSQISKNTKEIIDKLRKKNSAILYVGDMAQLPPVGEKGLSPIFDEYTVHELLYPFRYGGILAEYGEIVRKEILKGIRTGKFNRHIWKEFVNDGHENFQFFDITKSLEKREFFNQMVEHFMLDEKMSKYIAYHRWNYKKVASYIRNKLHQRKYDWEVGDVVMAKSNYYDEKGFLKMQNSQEGTITGKRLLSLAAIWVKDIDGSLSFLTLHKEKYQSKAKLKSYYSQTFDIASNSIIIEEINYWSHDIDNNKFIPTKPLKTNWVKNTVDKIFKNKIHYKSPCKHAGEAKDMVEETFCDIQYAYGLTSHTAQGSTYNYVFSSFNDIMSNKYADDLTKLQASYVAMTRARFKNFVLY